MLKKITKISFLRNTLLTSSLVIFTSCGGGPQDMVSDFIEQDLSRLSETSLIVTDWSNLLLSFNSLYSDVNSARLMSVLTKPDAEDKILAMALLNQLSQAESIWEETESVLAK